MTLSLAGPVSISIEPASASGQLASAWSRVKRQPSVASAIGPLTSRSEPLTAESQVRARLGAADHDPALGRGGARRDEQEQRRSGEACQSSAQAQDRSRSSACSRLGCVGIVSLEAGDIEHSLDLVPDSAEREAAVERLPGAHDQGDAGGVDELAAR